MTFNATLSEYYKHQSSFLYKGRLRKDIVEVAVLAATNCACGYETDMGRCDGTRIEVHYKSHPPHLTCPVYRDGLKFHPIISVNKRW